MQTFVKADEPKLIELGGGQSRKIRAYNQEMMLVEVIFESGAVGSDHSHEHTHDHAHPHTHEELHAMGIPHDHDHGHECSHSCDGCATPCEHTPMEELMALMQYMVGHNAAHARELADLAVQLDQAGNHTAYEQVMAAVSDFEKGNMRLTVVLSSLKG